MTDRWQKKCLNGLLIVLSLTICLSVVQVLAAFDIISFSTKELRIVQNYAQGLVEANLDAATELGISVDDPPIAWPAVNIRNMIDNATTPEEVYDIIMTEMNELERRIWEHADYSLAQDLKYIIGQDPNHEELESFPHEIHISFSGDNYVEIEGGEHLSPETQEQLMNYKIPEALRLQTVAVVIDLVDGLPVTAAREPALDVGSIVQLENQYKFLEQELHQLRAQAGHAELTGPGLTIYLDDAEFPIDSTEWFHAEDFYEIVHTLFANGAKGITVGGKRLIASSSIRCVGALVYVNNEAIAGKPWVIVAVGDSDAMLAALSPLFDYLTEQRGLRVEVMEEEEIHLPAYRRRQ
ncbi:MAG: DUF881 domain-containing protein [Firmicutes bacterium]|nr:DUF881 domain-containing protein [Bacillota bacterium]